MTVLHFAQARIRPVRPPPGRRHHSPHDGSPGRSHGDRAASEGRTRREGDRRHAHSRGHSHGRGDSRGRERTSGPPSPGAAPGGRERQRRLDLDTILDTGGSEVDGSDAGEGGSCDDSGGEGRAGGRARRDVEEVVDYKEAYLRLKARPP